jgi:dienelactone hydrolase
MTRAARRRLVGLAGAAALWLGAAASSVADEYRFPVADPLKASLLPAGYHPRRADYATSVLEVRAERRHVPRYEGKHRLILAVFAQRTPAPLVFVIPGVGGHALSEPALMLGEQLHALGFHAVTLPDPLSWQYALGVSESTLPGFLPVDAREYYDLLRRVAGHLATQHHLAITGHSVVGYSFGGLLAAFLARQDAEQRALGFARTVLINPAIDVRHAVDVVDGFYTAGDAIPEPRKAELSRAMVDTVIALKNRLLTAELARWAADQWTFSDREMRWLIGQSFREAAQGTILASRQIDEGRTPGAAPASRHLRMTEARRLSFGDYLSQLVFPALRRTGAVSGTDADLLAQTSLGALGPDLARNASVHVLHNADDFLARPEDLDALRGWLGDRLSLYPRGGHLGNLWVERNQEDLRSIMAPAASAR